MRQFAGFGTPEDTNARYKALLAAGGTGSERRLRLADADGSRPRPRRSSLGEVGKCGVSVASLADMEALFDGIPLGDITTSMTINSPAAMIFAMYLVVAEQQGADWRTLSGTIQNDILKEFIAQKEYIFPPRPSMRIVADIFAFCARAGAARGTRSRSAGIAHPRSRMRRRSRNWRSPCATASSTCSGASTPGSPVDDFVPRMSFFFNAHSDFFEEIAKYRAAADAVGARDARSIRRAGRTIVEAALPQPDGRRVAHRPAALQQRRPDGAAGAVGGASAARTRCIPTRSTRPWRCRRRPPRRSRCGPSRSSPTKAAWRTWSIRSAGRTSSSA